MKYTLIALILFACNNTSRYNKSKKISTELLDTIKSSPQRIIAQPELFETAFIEGTTQTVNDKLLNLYGINNRKN